MKNNISQSNKQVCDLGKTNKVGREIQNKHKQITPQFKTPVHCVSLTNARRKPKSVLLKLF